MQFNRFYTLLALLSMWFGVTCTVSDLDSDTTVKMHIEDIGLDSLQQNNKVLNPEKEGMFVLNSIMSGTGFKVKYSAYGALLELLKGADNRIVDSINLMNVYGSALYLVDSSHLMMFSQVQGSTIYTTIRIIVIEDSTFLTQIHLVSQTGSKNMMCPSNVDSATGFVNYVAKISKLPNSNVLDVKENFQLYNWQCDGVDSSWKEITHVLYDEQKKIFYSYHEMLSNLPIVGTSRKNNKFSGEVPVIELRAHKYAFIDGRWYELLKKGLIAIDYY